MRQNRFNLNCRAALLAAIAAAYPVMGYTAPAAQVDFAVGNVTAINATGQSRNLGKGAQIEQGDTVSTNGGRAQLRFADGAYVSLQPESQFRIDQYRFDGKQDGNEKGFFSLLKGGLRTITGLVGRTNKANYQVTTSVATIGIRGTEWTFSLNPQGGGATGAVGEGEINVCNSGGCQNFTNGEGFAIQNQGTKPSLTHKRGDLPPPPPQNPPPTFKEGETVGGDGKNCDVFPASCNIVTPLTGTLKLDAVTGDYCDGACISLSTSKTVVFDGAGRITELDSIPLGSVQMAGNDGIVAWGTFVASGGFSGFTHFVAGIPVPTSELTALGGTTGTYSLIGGTPVTDFNDNKIGTLNSASLTIQFGASANVSGAMNWTINGSSITAASLSGGGSGSNLSVFGNCGGSCQVSGTLSLFGAGAARAGMVYNIRDFVNIDAIGAAAFAKR